VIDGSTPLQSSVPTLLGPQGIAALVPAAQAPSAAQPASEPRAGHRTGSRIDGADQLLPTGKEGIASQLQSLRGAH